jgi:hypothetical protein
MRRVAPSVIAREQLQQLLGGGVGRESNIVSALVETVTRLVVQELAPHALWHQPAGAAGRERPIAEDGTWVD